MRKRHWGVVAAAVAFSTTLAVCALVGCGGTTEQADPAGDKTEEVVDTQSPTEDDGAADDQATNEQAPDTQDEAKTSDEQSSDTSDAGADAAAAASGTVEVGAFTFDIPAYWEGKVAVDITENEGFPSATVYLTGNPKAKLATLQLAGGDEPNVVGDIGLHVAGSISAGNGTHVEVWTTNWPWLAAMQAEGNDMALDVDDATLAELVDLSSGGVYSYDETVSDGSSAVESAEYNFANAELVPTVAFG